MDKYITIGVDDEETKFEKKSIAKIQILKKRSNILCKVLRIWLIDGTYKDIDYSRSSWDIDLIK
jgi:hypothetical protein